MIDLDKDAAQIHELTKTTKATVDSSASTLQALKISVAQLKAVTENANELYNQMKGADREGKKNMRGTYLKGIFSGILLGSTLWMVIWAIWLK